MSAETALEHHCWNTIILDRNDTVEAESSRTKRTQLKDLSLKHNSQHILSSGTSAHDVISTANNTLEMSALTTMSIPETDEFLQETMKRIREHFGG